MRDLFKNQRQYGQYAVIRAVYGPRIPRIPLEADKQV
jgi:hypothetical protein